MNKVYLVTEGTFDEEMLRKLLPKEVADRTEFVTGQGRYSAQSLARSILAAKKAPVALVVDADTIEPLAIEEQKDFLKEVLGQASAGTPFEVFLAVPELEVLLVESLDFLKTLAPHLHSTTELELARLQPKKFLIELLGEKNRQRMMNKIFKKMDKESLSAIRRHPLLENLTRFLSINQLSASLS